MPGGNSSSSPDSSSAWSSHGRPSPTASAHSSSSLINAGALFLAAARFAAPSESVFVFPTPAGLNSLWADLTRAFDVIRNGVEPVRPITGIVIILTALFWLLGALLAWGLSKDHPFVALLPPLVVALQFATLDRRTGGPMILAVFVVLVAGTVFAVAHDERDRGAGRMASSRAEPPSRAPAPTAALLVALAVTVAVLGTGMLGPTVPRDGTVTWRTPGGLSGGFYGSVSYNPYVGIHDGLVSQKGIPLFQATLDGDVPLNEVYFRLLTLETYRNGQWSASRPEVYRLDEAPLEEPGNEYVGGNPAASPPTSRSSPLPKSGSRHRTPWPGRPGARPRRFGFEGQTRRWSFAATARIGTWSIKCSPRCPK